ncbi:dephospho-CoA kinase [Synechococcus sp. BIOS-E4-1]|uniref:dephospho-CoA kinase n=1 Tax=Synechococcus sp. BIOS-E4-1 TaxID=1400864 RepID=UPI001646FE60|nr:dephospho-CoA kinase [Synechococcus sp. BIOS-E4-1]QNI56689.1 dephospho-CoA kinase [Synechococcus sp. BIOS-E4-1]
MSATSRWQGAQHRIGLTGGIASGKSTVACYLKELGIVVLDADTYSHEALQPETLASQMVLKRYGPQVEAEPECDIEPSAGQRTINRRELGRIVFNNLEERRWLEQLIHPIVRARFELELGKHPETAPIVLMIPLLFEADLTELVSEVWLVHCLPTQQLERLKQRDGLSAAEAKARIAAQWPLSQKCAKADLVLDNRSASICWERQIKARLALIKPGRR